MSAASGSQAYWRRNALFFLFLQLALFSGFSMYRILMNSRFASSIHFPYSFSSSAPFKPESIGHFVSSSSWEGLATPPNITLQQLFSSSITSSVNPESFPALTEELSKTSSDRPFASQFLPNPSKFVSIAMQNACIEPHHGGRLLLVGMNASDVAACRSRIPSLAYVWDHKYGLCGEESTYDCAGVRFSPRLPGNARWVAGNTLHFIAYSKGNTFHNFAERVWPRLAMSVKPLNETIAGLPLDHFFVHKLDQLLEEASTHQDRDQILWQLRMLMEVWRGSDLVRVQEEGSGEVTLCFETLLLQMHDKDRIDHTHAPPAIYTPALLKYREAVFKFLDVAIPTAAAPHGRLRVLYYGRGDGSRRRVVNSEEVVSFLQQRFTDKGLNVELRSLDLLLQASQTDYTFTRLVSLFSQTDVLIIAHGAFTWGSLFMPRGGLVIEVFGPCDFMKPRGNYSDLANMRSWIWSISDAVGLIHDTSNPFREAVANPRRGNTTLCLEPFRGVPDFTIDPLKVSQLVESFYANLTGTHTYSTLTS